MAVAAIVWAAGIVETLVPCVFVFVFAALSVCRAFFGFARLLGTAIVAGATLILLALVVFLHVGTNFAVVHKLCELFE